MERKGSSGRMYLSPGFTTGRRIGRSYLSFCCLQANGTATLQSYSETLSMKTLEGEPSLFYQTKLPPVCEE